MGINSVKEMVEEAIIKSRKLKEGILRAKWEEVVGKLYKKSKPIGIKEETLFVFVEDSVFLHHMTMNKNKYLKNIENILKDNYVKDIRFKVGKVEVEEYFLDEDMYMDNNSMDFQTPSSEDKIKKMSIDETIEYLKKISHERDEFLHKKGYKKCKKCGTMFKGESECCYPCSRGSDDECIYT